MTIVTKKEIGDIIFFLKDNKVVSASIEDIRTESKHSGLASQTKEGVKMEVITTVSYMVKVNNPKATYGYDIKIVDESNAFDSREQLIASL